MDSNYVYVVKKYSLYIINLNQLSRSRLLLQLKKVLLYDYKIRYYSNGYSIHIE